jgi:hypothetical protein
MARTVTSPHAQFLNPMPESSASHGKRTTDRDHSRFQVFTVGTWLFSADHARTIALASACVSATAKNELEGRQNFISVTSAT